MMILRGGRSFFPTMIYGGCGKFPTKMTSTKGGATLFFPEGGKEMKMCCWTDALIIPVFYCISKKNVDTELEYET